MPCSLVDRYDGFKVNVHICTPSKVRSLSPIYLSVSVPLMQTVAVKSPEYGKPACLLL
jgi:hypothetical protein